MSAELGVVGDQAQVGCPQSWGLSTEVDTVGDQVQLGAGPCLFRS